MTSASPYLSHPKRLSDVVALLQVMGAYNYSSRRPDVWSDTMGSLPVSAGSWQEIMQDHPEFFRLKDGLATLIWRRSYQKIYDPSRNRDWTQEELAATPENQRPRFTRRPLTDDQIVSLVESAVKFQTAAIAYNQESRWFLVVGASVIAGTLGFLLKACI